MRKRAITVVFLSLLVGACALFMPREAGPPEEFAVEITPQRVSLGTKLAEGIMACGSCHTTGNFVGDPDLDKYLAGDVWPNQSWGLVTVQNITPDKETGIGNWTDTELIRAVTEGLGRDGRQLIPLMPWAEYGAALTQEEIYAIVAYLRTVPEPVNNAVPAREVVMPFAALLSDGTIRNMLTGDPSFADYEPKTDTPVERGKRLSYLGACKACHSHAPQYPRPPQLGDPLAGGLHFHGPEGELILGANLTPDEETGIGAFTHEQLFETIKYGKRLRPLPDTEMVRWPMMQRITHHTSLKDEEINDLIAFFRSQEPIKHDILKKAEELGHK